MADLKKLKVHDMAQKMSKLPVKRASEDQLRKISSDKKRGQDLKAHTNSYHDKGETALDFRSSRKMMKHYNAKER